MPNEVLDLARQFMTNPIQMLVRPYEYTLDGIKQYFVAVEKEKYKLATLYDLFDCLTVRQAGIYANTRKKQNG